MNNINEKSALSPFERLPYNLKTPILNFCDDRTVIAVSSTSKLMRKVFIAYLSELSQKAFKEILKYLPENNREHYFFYLRNITYSLNINVLFFKINVIIKKFSNEFNQLLYANIQQKHEFIDLSEQMDSFSEKLEPRFVGLISKEIYMSKFTQRTEVNKPSSTLSTYQPYKEMLQLFEGYLVKDELYKAYDIIIYFDIADKVKAIEKLCNKLFFLKKFSDALDLLDTYYFNLDEDLAKEMNDKFDFNIIVKIISSSISDDLLKNYNFFVSNIFYFPHEQKEMCRDILISQLLSYPDLEKALGLIAEMKNSLKKQHFYKIIAFTYIDMKLINNDFIIILNHIDDPEFLMEVFHYLFKTMVNEKLIIDKTVFLKFISKMFNCISNLDQKFYINKKIFYHFLNFKHLYEDEIKLMIQGLEIFKEKNPKYTLDIKCMLDDLKSIFNKSEYSKYVDYTKILSLKNLSIKNENSPKTQLPDENPNQVNDALNIKDFNRNLNQNYTIEEKKKNEEEKQKNLQVFLKNSCEDGSQNKNSEKSIESNENFFKELIKNREFHVCITKIQAIENLSEKAHILNLLQIYNTELFDDSVEFEVFKFQLSEETRNIFTRKRSLSKVYLSDQSSDPIQDKDIRTPINSSTDYGSQIEPERKRFKSNDEKDSTNTISTLSVQNLSINFIKLMRLKKNVSSETFEKLLQDIVKNFLGQYGLKDLIEYIPHINLQLQSQVINLVIRYCVSKNDILTIIKLIKGIQDDRLRADLPFELFQYLMSKNKYRDIMDNISIFSKKEDRTMILNQMRRNIAMIDGESFELAVFKIWLEDTR